MTRPSDVARLWDKAAFWRSSAIVLTVALSAVFVAAFIGRVPADFSALPIVAVVRDGEQHPLWAIRLASGSHQIAADSLHPPAAPAGQVYQMWLVAPGAGPPLLLGLLPQSGRKAIAEAPANIRLLSGRGDLIVTLEPEGGSHRSGPSGPILFRGSLTGSG
jgi:anti-sigma-K factor RskA